MVKFKKAALVALALLSLHLSVVAQNVSLTLKNVTVKQAIEALKEKSGYLFVFQSGDLDVQRKVNVSATNQSVDQVVRQIVQGQNVRYEISGKSVIVKRSSESKTTAPAKAGRKVSGVVRDLNGDPLIGATVAIKGASQGTVTDLEGHFALQVSDDDQLTVSYVGYVPRTVKVSGRSVLDIVVEEDSKALNEVVVVGYGTQKKLNMTGAVVTASGDVLENRPIANVAQGLQGVIPNLNITFNSGQPNTAASINIRGNTSLNGGNALILVDGVEVADLSLVNPEDIESISVLKDASSAAVYGARAAFGVMLITTKKGERGQKTRVSYNNNFAMEVPANLPDMPRSDVWAESVNRWYAYSSPGGYYFNDRFMNALYGHINDPANNPAILVDTEGIQNSNYTPNSPGWAYVGNTNWIKEFYRSAALMQQHNVTLSGGSDRNNYYASVGYKDQDGIFRYGNDNYGRFNINFNFDTKVTKWLDLGLNFKYNNQTSDEPYMDNKGVDAVSWYYEVYRMFPTLSVFLPNGDYAGLYLRSGNYNVIGQMALAGRNVRNTNDFWYTGRFDLHPLKGLSIKGDYSFNQYLTSQRTTKNSYYQTMPEGVDPFLTENPNSVRNYKSNNQYQALNVWAEYKKSFDNSHNLILMAGYNQEGKRSTYTAITMTDLYDQNTPMLDLATNFKLAEEQDTEWRVQGLFFRFNYDYKSKYLLEVNGRYDGSTKYAKDDRWAFFPSASLGWRISEESFFKPLSSVVNNLKLRGSVGGLGNQVTNGNFQYLSYLSGVTMSNYMMDGKPLTGLNTPTLPSLVTWERVDTYDVGADISLFNNRLTGSFDYYIRDTKGMVQSKVYPAVLGTSGGKENVADMRTQGWELELNWKQQIGRVLNSPMQYSLTFGLSDYQAKITKFDNPTGSLSLNYVGKKMGEIWGYETDGYIMDDQEAARMNYIQRYITSTWFPGDIRYKDLDGNGLIDIGKNTLADSGDRRIIGNSTPRYQYNIQAGFSWKGFDLRLLFQGVGKRDLWISSDQFWGFSRDVYNANITQYHINNTWTYENPTAYFPRPTTGNNRSKQVQTKYLQDASFLRLKDVTLSYSLPKSVLTKLHAEKVSVYVSGLNLWEKTHLLPFMTPDIVDQISSSGLSDYNAGKQYAFMRNFSCGLSITF